MMQLARQPLRASWLRALLGDCQIPFIPLQPPGLIYYVLSVMSMLRTSTSASYGVLMIQECIC